MLYEKLRKFKTLQKITSKIQKTVKSITTERKTNMI